MRIGIFIDTYNYGGAEAVAISSAEFLRAAGHAPVLYHFGNEYIEEACADHGIKSARLRSRFAYKATYRLPWFAWTFSRALRSDGVDLLHSHLFGPIVAGGLATRLAGIPHVGTLHDVYTIEQRPARARLLKLVRVLGTELVCVSDEMVEFYCRAAKIDASEIRTIRNGVDLSRFQNRPRTTPTDGGVALLSVGRLDPIKRHDLLLSTLAQLSSRSDWSLSIAGEGPEEQRLRILTADLGLQARVRFLGHQRDIPALLADADVFLLISDSEGMSLSLIEAVASGLPIIATDVGNNSSLVTNEWNGFVIEPGNSEQLEEVLVKLLDDHDLRSRLAEHSRQLSQSSLDSKSTFEAYLQLYSDLTLSRAPRAFR